MAHSDRFSWLRRDGAPLLISLVLHVLALLLIAPWLVMRSIPSQQIEVEVMLEPDTGAPSFRRPEPAARQRALVKAPAVPVKPQAAPLRPKAMEVTQQQEPAPPSQTPATPPGQGLAGASAPAPREAPGLSAPTGPAVLSAKLGASVGSAPLLRGMMETAPATTRAPSAGSAPQPSARAAAAPSQPGAERDSGPLTLAGPVPQTPSAQPEFSQAARQGGHLSMRGGSQAPEDGLARQPGSPDQTALLAARAVPLAQPGAAAGGSQGGTMTAMTPPPLQSMGQGGVAVTERTAAAGPALAAAPVAGQAAPFTSRAQTGSGLSDAGIGSGSRTVSRDDSGRSGLIAAAAPSAMGPGSSTTGGGSGASEAGEGRAQQLAGSGSAARDAAAPMQAAGGGAIAARGETDSSGAQLSGHTDVPVPAQAVREARAMPLQTQRPTGQAQVIAERFTAPALKVDSPRTVCELPLMFAGFDRKPIPKGLDTINASEPMQGEIPPRHLPSNRTPGYPAVALAQRAEGRTLVRAEIRPDGLVGQLLIKQSSGFQTLDQAALETVRSWRFYPAQRHGMPVAMWMDVPIEYKVP